MKRVTRLPGVRGLLAADKASKATSRAVQHARTVSRRGMHASARRDVVKPFLLADIGEGITEVQIIQWFVQSGARVEQFDKLCEVQSDKASVEITSRYDGVIRKLHYSADDMAVVGKPLVDIDVDAAVADSEDFADAPPVKSPTTSPSVPSKHSSPPQPEDTPTSQNHASQPNLPQKQPAQAQAAKSDAHDPTLGRDGATGPNGSGTLRAQSTGKIASLATPAIRHLVREHGVDISEVRGSGRDGRVLREDVLAHVAGRGEERGARDGVGMGAQEDRSVMLTAMQHAMFKSMTRSLAIPHFLYSDGVDLGPLNALRRELNASFAAASSSTSNATAAGTTGPTTAADRPTKLTLLPFLLKAVSLVLADYPILNALLTVPPPSPNGAAASRPQLTYRSAHNISIAVDSPSGLLVPVVHNVQTHSIRSLAAEISRLSTLARAGTLGTAHLTGGTFCVSNVGSIGGGVVAPVLAEGTVGIIGVGRVRTVPAFDEKGAVVRREEATFSWSADHRVVDGATVARAGERLRGLLESPGRMLVDLR